MRGTGSPRRSAPRCTASFRSSRAILRCCLRPKGMDAHCGPFLDPTALEAVFSEMGRLAVQAGEIFGAFGPERWGPGIQTRLDFDARKRAWLQEFYSVT
jgi:hypothetical protein